MDMINLPIKIGRRLKRHVLKAALGLHSASDHFYIDAFSNPPVIVDLGAGKGTFSSELLRLYPNCTMILVEPDPSLVHALTTSFADNANIYVLNAAIANRLHNYTRLYLSKDWQFNSIYKHISELGESRNEDTGIDVQAITLKDLYSRFDIKSIDLLKMDIEGAEFEVFDSFSTEDFERICQISVEFHDFADSSFRKRTELCIRLLKHLGYSFIHEGVDIFNGSPYFNCLFYDKNRLAKHTPRR